jgi:glycerol kinase
MSTTAVLAIDQGSGSTKALLLDVLGHVIARGTAEVHTEHPQPGWVQQDALHLWDTVQRAVAAALAQVPDVQVAAIGLSTQRESLVVWSRSTGQPLAPVLTWQDRRSAGLLTRFADARDTIRNISGLPLDPMFTALKAAVVLPQIAVDADVCIGTIDSWLLWNLGAGHVIEVGNASRTQLLDVATGEWSRQLIALFGVPESCLPAVVASNTVHPIADGALPGIPAGTPVSGVLGDSHAALFAHAGWLAGLSNGIAIFLCPLAGILMDYVGYKMWIQVLAGVLTTTAYLMLLSATVSPVPSLVLLAICVSFTPTILKSSVPNLVLPAVYGSVSLFKQRHGLCVLVR